jgi:hypothetical protein
LFYNKNQEDGDPVEILYSYFVPYQVSQNNTPTYSEFLDLDRDSFFSIYSVPVTKGITVYFAKSQDVKEWVVHDLSIVGPKITQRYAFNQSLTKRNAYQGFIYYQRYALKYGFTRVFYDDYRRIFKKNRS